MIYFTEIKVVYSIYNFSFYLYSYFIYCFCYFEINHQILI